MLVKLLARLCIPASALHFRTFGCRLHYELRKLHFRWDFTERSVGSCNGRQRGASLCRPEKIAYREEALYRCCSEVRKRSIRRRRFLSVVFAPVGMTILWISMREHIGATTKTSFSPTRHIPVCSLVDSVV